MIDPNLTAHAGSMRTTLFTMGALALAVLAGTLTERGSGLALGLGFGVLAVNLAAALVVNPALRRRLPLLVAHLALLALLALVALGRLTALDGRFEMTQGVPFDGRLIDVRAGALHPRGLEHLSFRHEGFDIDYAPGRKRGATRNRVAWRAVDGSEQRAVIGDHHPLVLDGYRFYTSPNKGFAPLLTWRPAQGEAVTGAVHLPSFPMHELRQSREWLLPDGREVWVMLQIDEALIDAKERAAFRLPDRAVLVVRHGDRRVELVPGAQMTLDGGTLVYEGLRTWMGYRVAYDPTLPWLLAAALLAALSLGWHYLLKFAFAGTSRRAVDEAPKIGVLDA